MTLAAIDWGQLFELAWASVLGTIVISGTFSLVILGATRASDLRREDRARAATAYAALAVVSALLFAATVVFGVSVIVAK
jgi:hypothetical protein